MPWLQIKLDCDTQLCDKLEDALLAAGAIAVTMEDSADQPLFEPPPGETPLWNHIRLTGLFDAACDSNALPTAVAAALGSQLPPYRCEILEDKDWEREWMKNYHPMQFGKKLWICPSWTPPPQPDAINILLDPGLAFGTGTHPTTALCLKWLDAQNLHDKTVIDYGCGSGILAIAALLLGASHVIAIDNDPQALLATRDNAKRNNIDDTRLTVMQPQELTLEAQADIVVANILANPLIMLTNTLSKLIKPDGLLCLSGILAEQANDVQKAYQQRFEFLPGHLQQTEDWVRISGRKLP